jgi:hypothetical protein
MAMDFDKTKIEIRYNSTDYGPFKFDFTNAIPSGTTLSSVTVKSYLGKVNPEDALASETDTSSELVDTVKTVVSSSYIVSVYFNYPTTAAYKSDVAHTLIFEITLSNSAKHAYYFYEVRVM